MQLLYCLVFSQQKSVCDGTLNTTLYLCPYKNVDFIKRPILKYNFVLFCSLPLDPFNMFIGLDKLFTAAAGAV